MEIASHNYKITDSKGCGHWSLYFIFQNSAVPNILPSKIQCEHDIIGRTSDG
ncbi:MAG: hypothetical protein ACI88H_002553 [Cocleimonas sp.]|jgi:hypothetical protein